MSNSSLVSYTQISPNKNSPRNHKIDTITIHCYVGQASVQSMAAWFLNPNAKASSNYGIGFDGKVGLFVEEKDRSWCTSSRENDHRAITIECACDEYHPYTINTKVYTTLIKLVADICKRNGITKLVWSTDKKERMNHLNGCNMTVHRDYANKACPGDYIYNRLGTIAKEVNAMLGVKEESTTQTPSTDEKDNARIIWDFLKSKGLNDYAVAGVMGNLRAESALDPENMQDSFEQRLGYNDTSYTKAVDDGMYKNFIYDSCGYGLAQWTFWSRKKALLEYAKSRNVSIGNLTMQLDFLWMEMCNYTSMMNVLKNAKSVREASNAMLFDFEKPGDMGTAQQNKRANYGQEYYNQFVNKSNTLSQEPTTQKKKEIQCGSFSVKKNAENKAVKVRMAGFDAYVKAVDNVYKVRITVDADEAETMLKKVKNAGFIDAFIVK